MFAFRDAKDKPVYWIYNYKRGAFYPFVPAGGEQQRDSERELRLKAQIGAELPVEAELERWFPLWGHPDLVAAIEALRRELGRGLDERGVGRREDHVGPLELVGVERRALGADEREHLLERLVEAVLVAGLDRRDDARCRGR